MTAQIPDKVRYKGEEYAIIGVKGEALLTPDAFGIQVAMWHTACWRGYVATYTCATRDLVLAELHIGHLAGEAEWKGINGVEPETVYVEVGKLGKDGKLEPETREDGKRYRNLNVKTYYSGGILIASGFIQALYVHMGFGKPYQYEKVLELLFHEGTLVEAIDHSAKAATWRAEILRQEEERRRHIEELRDSGLSEEEISQQLLQLPTQDDIARHVEWRFSLDYDEWF